MTALVPVAPEVRAAIVALPAGVLELDTHSSLEADPSESLPPPVSIAPMVLRFLCLDDSESDTEIPERHLSPTRFIDNELFLSDPRRTFPLVDFTVLILDLLDRFTFGSPSSHSSSDHSSSRHPSSGHSLSRHTPPDITDADSSTPQRFVHQPLARAPRCSEAYLCWRSVMLSTMYPPMTSESSVGDSSSESSAGPSRKRCRSPAATVTSSIHYTRALVPSCADLLPPRKRFRDSISQEDIIEEDIDTDVLEDIKADATAIEISVDRDVKAGIDVGIGIEVDVGIDVEDEVENEVESSDRGIIEVEVDMDAGIIIPDGMLMPDAVKRLEQVKEGLQDIYDHVINIPLQRIEDIETTQKQLEAEHDYHSISYDPKAIEELVNRRVEEALAAYEETRAANALEAENQSQNGSNGNGGNGNGGNRNGVNGRNGNLNKNGRGDRHVARECIYQDFMKCQPLNFKGTKRVFGFTRWFEKMEIVFHISNCPEKYQVKYATCTLLNSALTWWNSHKRTVRTDAAFAMSWRELIKLMAKVYCLRNKVQKMESELMVPGEEDRIERYVGGLPDNSRECDIY
uniref:Reverse transcriptase domain-containing protein n=1 Tax=Tanacetum cinerariifolium TaxID=118510 RepID=A0A6L2MLC6_TANCI|nr:hypothetical protein [Tanacetum cinerariifolium]